MTVIEGPGIMMGDTDLDALVASSLETPVVLTMNGQARMSANETFNHVVSCGLCLRILYAVELMHSCAVVPFISVFSPHYCPPLPTSPQR